MADPREHYFSQGYVHLPQFLLPSIANAFLERLKLELGQQGANFATLLRDGPLLSRPAAELYSNHYPPMAHFHWGMTPAICEILGQHVLPTYAYFRLYRAGDICRVHGDRHACEHSLSLTLAYSDGKPWELEVSPLRTDKPYQRADDTFRADEQASGVAMAAGDAVLYQGVHHHHGRTRPNPNAWSAHLFLHWVSRDGPYADQAFDGQVPPERVAL